MTGPQLFKNGLQSILECIPKLVDEKANVRESIEENLRDQLPDFIPTAEELIHLAKYWLKTIIDEHSIWFFHKDLLLGSPMLHVAKYRIERILEHGVLFEQGKGLWDSKYDEVPEFVCIRFELKELIKHWAEKAFRYEIYIFAYSFGRSDLILKDSMWSRVERIREVLGDSETVKIVNYVKSILSAEDKSWNIFLNGTEAEREALWKEIDRARNGIQ